MQDRDEAAMLRWIAEHPNEDAGRLVLAEIHVSTSRDHRDVHAKLTDETWGVEWAKERLGTGTPVILECYMHKLTNEERLEQIARLITI